MSDVKRLAEGVEAAVKRGDVEAAVEHAKAMHDAIGARTILDYEAAVEALERLVGSASLIRSRDGSYYTVGFDQLNEAAESLARLREKVPG